jgi:hypothetical protein
MSEALLALASDLEARGHALAGAADLIRRAFGPSLELGVVEPAPTVALPAPKRARRAKTKAKAAKKAASAVADPVDRPKVDRKARRAKVIALIAEGKTDREIHAATGASIAGINYIRHHAPAKDNSSPR